MHGTNEVIAVVGNSFRLSIPANANRVGLVFCSPTVNPFTLVRNINSDVAGGMIFPINFPPQVIRIEDYGSWLTGQLWIVATPGDTITYLEVICPCRDAPLAR